MIFKNKFRNLPVDKKTQEPYTPEYKKAGIQPNVAENILIKGSGAPRNIRVNSGQSEDLAWVSQSRQNATPAIIDNNKNVIIKEVRERTFVNDSYEDGANKNTPIAYDDIPDYTPNVVDSNEVVGNFSDVSIGEFVLVYENEILGAGTYDQVTEAIEEMLLSDKDGSISPQSLIVFKRMQILTGVLIKDV